MGAAGRKEDVSMEKMIQVGRKQPLQFCAGSLLVSHNAVQKWLS